MWRQTLASGVLYLLSAEYSSNVRGLDGNLSDLTVASSQYDILSQYDFGLRYESRVEVLVPGFGRPVLFCRARCLGPLGWLQTFEMFTEHFANQNLIVVVAKCWFLAFLV